MELRILGPLTLVDGEGRSVPLGRPKERMVLAFLLTRANRTATVDAIADALWDGEPPDSAVNLVQGYISKLRRALARATSEDGVTVATTPAGYRLELGRTQLDADRFATLLGRATDVHDAPEAAEAALNDALALWKGPVLADMADATFARVEIARLNQLRVAACEERVDARLALGRHDTVAVEVAALVAEHPERERFRAQQMLALYRSGRQQEALAAYSAARTYLVEELGLDPGPELQRLEHAILSHDAELEYVRQPTLTNRTGNVAKPLTSFVGRARERAIVEDLIANHRFVTLTGTGGSGKTRLALETGVAIAGRFSDGVWFVDLSTVPAGAGGDAVAASVAAGLGLRVGGRANDAIMDVVIASLRDRRALVILDNCEHVLSGTSRFLGALLADSGSVTLLVTSREPTQVAGEHAVAVSPLRVPPSDAADGEALARVESVQLFVDRASAAYADFALTDKTVDAVARVCRSVGGIPLAVELAAAQVAAFSVEQIAARIDRAVARRDGRMLPGQTAIEDSINWSYQLLASSEQLLFDALSVFAGSFDLDAVEAVVPDRNALADFANLVRKSLVQRDENDADRYRVLEPLKQFAADRLDERGRTTEMRARHAEVFARRAHEAHTNLFGVAAPIWLARLDHDIENIRAALAFGFEVGGSSATVAATAAADLWFYWHLRGLLAEGRRWLEAALTFVGPDQPDLRFRVLFSAAVQAQGLGDFDAELALLNEALALVETLDDPAAACMVHGALGGPAWARGDLELADACYARSVELGRPLGHWNAAAAQAQRGRVAKDRGDHDRAVLLMEDGLAMARQLDFDMGIALALDFLARVAVDHADLDGAQGLAEESLRHYRAIAYEEGIASALQTLGRVAHQRGDDDASAAAFGEVLLRCRRAGHRGGTANGLEGVAAVLASRGRITDAAQLFGTATRLRREIGGYEITTDGDSRNEVLARLQDELGATFAAAWDVGSSLHVDEAIELALRG